MLLFSRFCFFGHRYKWHDFFTTNAFAHVACRVFLKTLNLQKQLLYTVSIFKNFAELTGKTPSKRLFGISCRTHAYNFIKMRCDTGVLQ